MALLGIDIAWDRPTVAEIQATGAHWVARYFSPDTSKNLTAAEVVSYPAAGLGIVTVYESTAARALAGFAAGQDDARAAEVQRKAVGLSLDHVHHFAVDTDTSWGAVWPYFQGVLSVLPLSRVGVYGGVAVIQGAHGRGFRYLWQTVAWSGGVWAPYATIRQTGGELLGGAADVDYAQAVDFGQSPRPPIPAPSPTPEDDVTPQDIQAIAAAVVELQQKDRDALAFSPLYWIRRIIDPTLPLPTGKNLPGVVAEVQAARAALAAREQALIAAIIKSKF